MSESKKKMTALAAHHIGRLRLPPGYHLEAEADILVIYRQDCSVAATFSARDVAPPR
jgi:hypothetical protein